MSNGHGPEAAMTDRPIRPLESIIQHAAGQADQADNIQRRLHDIVGRLQTGNTPSHGGGPEKSAPAEALPELPTIMRSQGELQRFLDSMLEAVSALESL